MSFTTLKQKKQFRLRVLAFLVLHALIGLHLAAWYLWDIRLIGAIDMQELFRNLLEKNVLTTGGLFFLLCIGVGLLWGRLFCGWFCHIGQVYDMLAAWFRRLGLKLRPFPLRFGPLAAAFVLLFYFVREGLQQRTAGPLVVDWDATEPWELLPGPVNALVLLFLVWVLMPLLMGARTFCRNICPWGVLLGLTNRLAPFKVRRVGDCTNCGACGPACPMDIDVSYQINTAFHVASSACTNCLQCVAACPTDALKFSTRSQEQRAPRDLPLLPKMAHMPLKKEGLFWLLVFVPALVYDELYGLGIFLAWCLALVLAWCTLQWPLIKQRALTVLALIGLAGSWAVVGKDALADYHWRAGHQAWEARDMKGVQAHYEAADRLFWRTPTVLMYRLYMVYKATGQEDRRAALYRRYEARRAKLGKKDAS